MHGPPGPMAEPLAQQAGDHQGDQQVDRDGPQPQPERPVARHEREEDVHDPDGRVAVEHGGDDVHGQHRHRQQSGVLVQGRDHETGPARPGEAHRLGQAQHHGQA